MELENTILSCAGKSREAYYNVSAYLEDSEFSPISQAIWKEVERYYEQDPNALSVEWDIIKGSLRRRAVTDNQGEVYARAVDLVTKRDVSEVNLTTLLTDFKRDSLGMLLAQKLLQKDHSGAADLLDNYKSLDRSERKDQDDNVLHNVSIDDLFRATDNSNKIKLSPAALDEATDGGVFPGNHIIVFARPEIGKSAFCTNLAAYMVYSGKRVLWVENEDPKWTVIKRFVSRLTGIPKAELGLHKDRVQELCAKRGLDRFIVADASPGSRREIQRLVDRFNPEVLFINQLRNIRTKGGSMEGRVNQLEQAALDARTLAKRNGLVVVSVTQAGDSATDKDVLTISDIDNSKTGIPSQADLLIGIGASPQTKEQGMRMISICKNKLKENSTDVFFPVWYDPFIDRMESE